MLLYSGPIDSVYSLVLPAHVAFGISTKKVIVMNQSMSIRYADHTCPLPTVCGDIHSSLQSLFTEGYNNTITVFVICIHWSSFCGIFQAELGGSIVTTYITCLGGGRRRKGVLVFIAA